MSRRRLPIAALGLSGLLLLAQGFWIPAKAVLAQQLLEEAWRRTRGGEEAVRPWPWADSWPVARLSVPQLGVSVIVLEGATGRTLAFGPGHVAGSADPGAPGNTVFAGHRDTHFAFLRQLEPGDELLLETPDGRAMPYLVVGRRIVDERDPSPLAWTDTPLLSLLTCYPFDTPIPGGPLRYLVTAEPS